MRRSVAMGLVLVACAWMAGGPAEALSPLAQAGSQNGAQGAQADRMIQRIDQRVAKMKEKIAQRQAQRASGAQGAQGQGGRGQAGQGGQNGGGRKGQKGQAFARIQQRLQNSNMSEADKQRVMARLQSARQELQAMRGHRNGHRRQQLPPTQ